MVQLGCSPFVLSLLAFSAVQKVVLSTAISRKLSSDTVDPRMVKESPSSFIRAHRREVEVGSSGLLHHARPDSLTELFASSDLESLSGCDQNPQSTPTAALGHLADALKDVCGDQQLRKLMEFWLPTVFKQTYSNFYDTDGWTDEGYLTYFYSNAADPLGKSGPVHILDHWIKALHIASNRPMVIFHVGSQRQFQHVLKRWTPQMFPRLVLLHMSDYSGDPAFASKIGNHSHKFRAALLARMRRAILMDVDEIVLPAPGRMDALFQRIQDESNEQYPYPIIQAHWLSKDPRSDPQIEGYHLYDWHCTSNPSLCGEQLTRWGQSNIMTWGSPALPFISKMYFDYVLGKGPEEVVAVPYDEPTLNWHLWQAKALKQWCRLDIPFAPTLQELGIEAAAPTLFSFANLFRALDTQGIEGADLVEKLENDIHSVDFKDSFWFPQGLPRSMLAAHNVKDPRQAEKLVALAPFLEKFANGSATWYYAGKAWSSEALREEHPQVGCLLV